MTRDEHEHRKHTAYGISGKQNQKLGLFLSKRGRIWLHAKSKRLQGSQNILKKKVKCIISFYRLIMSNKLWTGHRDHPPPSLLVSENEVWERVPLSSFYAERNYAPKVFKVNQ